MLLPSWSRNGRPVTFNLKQRGIPIPALPLLLLVAGVLYLVATRLAPPPLTMYDLPRTSSPFLVPPDKLPPLPLAPEWEYIPPPGKPKLPGMRVPNTVHYVFGLKPLKDGRREELPYYAYLAMRSAIVRLKPDKVYFHYKNLPTGPWWDLIAPHLTLIETHVPTEIFGRPLDKFAHQADVVRLYAIQQAGGIYLDIDVFVTKSFDDLLYFPTTLGMEASPNSNDGPLEPTGLCNAVIIAEPQAPFIKHWIDTYVNFDRDDWAGHSVRKPWELARRHPGELQVLNSRAFFWPMWHGNEVAKVHENNDYDFYGTGQYAYHAWESLAMNYLGYLTPESIRTVDTSFHRLVRPLIGPEDDRVYKEWALKRGPK